MIKEHDMIQERILELVKYGLTTGLVDPADEVYTVNRLLEVLGVDDIEDETFEKAAAQPAWTQEEAEEKLEGILEDMMTYAYDNGIMKENSIVYKDLFDTKLMGCLVNAPSVIRALIFLTELALWICALLCIFSGSNCLWILLRL